MMVLVPVETIITIWLQVTSKGLPDAQSASQSKGDWVKQKRQFCYGTNANSVQSQRTCKIDI